MTKRRAQVQRARLSYLIHYLAAGCSTIRLDTVRGQIRAPTPVPYTRPAPLKALNTQLTSQAQRLNQSLQYCLL